MKKYVFLIALFVFSFLITHLDVSAASLSLQYNDVVSSSEELEEIQSNFLSSNFHNEKSWKWSGEVVLKFEKSFFLSGPSDFNLTSFNSGYLVCNYDEYSTFVNLQSLSTNRYNTSNRCSVLNEDFTVYYNPDYNSNGTFSLKALLDNNFYNLIVYSTSPVIYKSYNTLEFYNNSDLIYTVSSYGYDFVNLRSDTNYFNLLGPKFEDNTLDQISRKILGEVPKEFEFLYMIFDYILVLGVVIVILSPFVFIFYILGWFK